MMISFIGRTKRMSFSRDEEDEVGYSDLRMKGVLEVESDEIIMMLSSAKGAAAY